MEKLKMRIFHSQRISPLLYKLTSTFPFKFSARGLKTANEPQTYSSVVYPLWEKRKLPLLLKAPQFGGHVKPRRGPKRLIDNRGPELVHNQLTHKQFGIQALVGGNLRFGHIESLRLNFNRKMDVNKTFAIWRIDPPYKPVTRKPKGSRMGGGKGAIDHYITPVKAGRMIIEMGGTIQLDEVRYILRIAAHNLPFRARVVTQQMLEEEASEEAEIQEKNENPFGFEYAAQNNLLGCQRYLSKYDYLWHNKYR